MGLCNYNVIYNIKLKNVKERFLKKNWFVLFKLKLIILELIKKNAWFSKIFS